MLLKVLIVLLYVVFFTTFVLQRWEKDIFYKSFFIY